jgi:hypothetical protein
MVHKFIAYLCWGFGAGGCEEQQTQKRIPSLRDGMTNKKVE